MDLVQQYLEQILKQTGGERGPTATAQPATKLLKAPTPKELIASKRNKTGFKRTWEPTKKSIFQRKAPGIKEFLCNGTTPVVCGGPNS